MPTNVYGSYNDLYRHDRNPRPGLSALCWAHARLRFFEMADSAGNVRHGKPADQISPVAIESVKRIDATFDIERDINGLDLMARLEARSVCRPCS